MTFKCNEHENISTLIPQALAVADLDTEVPAIPRDQNTAMARLMGAGGILQDLQDALVKGFYENNMNLIVELIILL